jgi:heat shock protein HslJ
MVYNGCMINERPHVHSHAKHPHVKDHFVLRSFMFALVGVGLALGLLALVGRLDFGTEKTVIDSSDHRGPKGDLSSFIPKPILPGTGWTMVSISKKGVVEDVSKKGFTLFFDEKVKSLSLKVCNLGTAFFSENGPSFVAIKPITITRMMCSDSIMNVERALIAALESGVVYNVQQQNLVLRSEGTSYVFIFSPNK